MSELKKIVVIGPESTGKSTLCQLLAEHYNTRWCPEYAREYLLTNGVSYTYQDLLAIAKGQLALEDEYTKFLKGEASIIKPSDNDDTANGNRELKIEDNISKPAADLLFVDTDMYIMKVWCEYVFGKCHSFILEQIDVRKYDLYLLCNPDLPWEPDVLREYPDEAARIELYGIYKNLLQNQSTPFVEITGNYDERLQKAIKAVDELYGRS